MPGGVAFAVGTGRCGTYLAYELMRRDLGAASSHERNVLAECFHRYCTWYGLPVDEAAFIAAKRREIEADLEAHDLSFEASAPLSFSVSTLHRAFGARFVLLVRHPVDVVNSYLSKGWFAEEIHWADKSLAPGFHSEHKHAHHSFGRLMPAGPALEAWHTMGRVGKLAWTWATVNRAVASAFRSLPAADTLTLRIEEFDFDAYRRLAEFLGRAAVLDEAAFARLAGSRPNTRAHKPSIASWSTTDVAEFRTQAEVAAGEFGYSIDLTTAGTSVDGWHLAARSSDRYMTRLRRGVRGAVAAFRAGFRQSAD